MSTIISPAHYAAGGMEPIDYLKLKLTPEEFAGFCKGNVIKYLSRANHKNGEEDLKKAAFYARFLAGDDPRKNSGPIIVELIGQFESPEGLKTILTWANTHNKAVVVHGDGIALGKSISAQDQCMVKGQYTILDLSEVEGYMKGGWSQVLV